MAVRFGISKVRIVYSVIQNIAKNHQQIVHNQIPQINAYCVKMDFCSLILSAMKLKNVNLLILIVDSAIYAQLILFCLKAIAIQVNSSEILFLAMLIHIPRSYRA